MNFPSWTFKVGVRTVKTYFNSHGSYLAGSIAYFMILSIIPVIMLCASVLGFVFGYNEAVKTSFIKYLSMNLPAIDESAAKTIYLAIEGRNALGIAGLVLIFWIAKNIIFALDVALSEVFEQPKRRFFFDILYTLFMVMFIVVFVVVSMFWEVAASYINAMYHLPFGDKIMSYGFTFLTSLALFYAIYRIIPKNKPALHEALAGAFVGALFWEALKWGFSIYLAKAVVRYDVVYGSFATMVYLILWAYVYAISIVLGACVIRAIWTVKDESGHKL